MTPGDSRSRASQHMPSSHHPRQHDEAVDIHSLRFLKFQDTSTGIAADSFCVGMSGFSLRVRLPMVVLSQAI
jgi:hypothetical protein